ncbi:MAG: hypothetical protein Q9200_007391 [Gallowayella weberi]
MATPPTLHLRSALQTLKPQSSLFRTSHAASQTRRFTQLTTSKPSLRHRISPSQQSSLPTLRFASDTSTQPASSHPSASSPAASNPASIPAASSLSSTASPSTKPPSNTPSPSPPNTNPLTWNTYLSLRRLRRRYSLLASLLTCTSTTTLGFITIERNMDALGSTLGGITGLDPIYMLAAATIATGGVGWLLGPFVGEGVFRGIYRREWWRMAEVNDLSTPFRKRNNLGESMVYMLTPDIKKTQKEKDFYARIRKYRVDPSLASYSNPLPDYYGEKIGSVQDFRTWMRDQRAYNRKRLAV